MVLFSSLAKKFVVITISSSLLVGCTKSESDAGEQRSAGDGRSFTVDCGVVFNGDVTNPVSADEGIEVRAEVADANVLVIEPVAGGQPQLIKLHGIGQGDEHSRNASMMLLRSITSGKLYYYPAGEGCTADVPGGRATVGSLITSDGRSVAEELARTGLVPISNNDICGGGEIESCLVALQETDELTAGELSEFLWKPESDSDGNLAIHTGPSNTIVVVNGETGENQGGGNGFGSLARFSRNGCAYQGPSIRVMNKDGIPYTVAGQTSFTVSDPCQRHCLEGGQIVRCYK